MTDHFRDATKLIPDLARLRELLARIQADCPLPWRLAPGSCVAFDASNRFVYWGDTQMEVDAINALPALIDAAEERERLAADNAALRECLREIVKHSRNGMTHAEWMEWGRLLHGRPNTVALALRAAELCGLDTYAPNHPETPDSSMEVES